MITRLSTSRPTARTTRGMADMLISGPRRVLLALPV
jgi:hypothetical protein